MQYEIYIPTIDKFLLEWKNDRHRKPLLLRGARQVGKSSTIRNLGKSFRYFIEINLEKRPDTIQIFQNISDVHEIAQRLSLIAEVPLIDGETLLFIDEIQFSPDAIRMLRYFKEDYPQLHVIAAGSLLEFALANLSSFGVGRITSLFMYPMSFREFLIASGKNAWVNAIEKAGPDKPIFDALHNSLVESLRTFLLIGGMPASVAVWLDDHSYLKCAEIQEDIQQTYFDDFSKYSQKANPELLRATLQSVIVQNGSKFVYSRGLEAYKISEVKEALSMLCRAGLIHEVSMTSANGLPLGADTNPKFKKFLFLDTGLMLRIQGLDVSVGQVNEEFILTSSATDFVNKGSIAEMFVGLEFIKNGNPRIRENLYYWENLSRGASAEVDFITAVNMSIIPVEVKAGVSGKMKSLRYFMEKKSFHSAIRTSLENFGILRFRSAKGQPDTAVEDEYFINIIPLYGIYNYRNYMLGTSLQPT